jgi:hypothetical protein
MGSWKAEAHIFLQYDYLYIDSLHPDKIHYTSGLLMYHSGLSRIDQNGSKWLHNQAKAVCLTVCLSHHRTFERLFKFAYITAVYSLWKITDLITIIKSSLHFVVAALS